MATRLIPQSARSKRAIRTGSAFKHRGGLWRLDRNEDPQGWAKEHLQDVLDTVTADDLAAYPDSQPLQAAIAQWAGVSEDCVIISHGSTEGLRLIFETYLDDTTHVIHLDPTYSLYELYEMIQGCSVTKIPYVFQRATVDLAKTWAHLLDAVSSRPGSLVIFANPDQPLGATRSLKDLTALADAAQSVGSILIVDEAYHFFGAESALPLLRTHSNTMVVRTFSKAFGLAGIRIGYILSNASIIQELTALQLAVPPSGLSLKLALSSIQRSPDFEQRAQEIAEGRDWLDTHLRSRGIKALPSKGNFLLIPCPSHDDALNVIEEIRNKGFAIKGPLSVQGLGECIRITAGSRPLMEEFLQSCLPVLVEHFT